MLDGISLGSLDGASLGSLDGLSDGFLLPDFPDFSDFPDFPSRFSRFSRRAAPDDVDDDVTDDDPPPTAASIPAANEEEKSMGIDASSLMARARIRFLPSFLTLTIRSALAASVAIAMKRRWMGATLILVWMGVLARIRGESS